MGSPKDFLFLYESVRKKEERGFGHKFVKILYLRHTNQKHVFELSEGNQGRPLVARNYTPGSQHCYKKTFS